MISQRNRTLNIKWIVAITLGIAVSRGVMLAQTSTGDIKTAGSCSPVLVQPRGSFQIICHDSTLTHAEAVREAKLVSELLSKLRATSQDNAEMTQKLDQILQKLSDLDEMTSLSAAPIYTIPVINGVATPDLSKGLTQRVLLHSDIVIAAPRLPQRRKPETIIWTLFVEQDATGNHQYKTELMEPKTNWPGLIGNVRSTFELITDTSGATMMRAVPIVNSLPQQPAKP